MANLANKYRPKDWGDVTEQKLVVDMLKNMCDDPDFNNRNFLLTGPAGCGKANPLYTEILTPTGYIKMGDIKVGDEVFTHTGSVGKVSGVYPQGKKPVYRITLSDRTHIDVSDEHINVVWMDDPNTHQHNYHEVITKDLLTLFKGSDSKIYVDMPTIDWEEKPIEEDPFLLGVFAAGSHLEKCSKSEDYGLVCNKVLETGEIPDSYIYTSRNVRIEVMRGIFSVSGEKLDTNTFTFKLHNKSLSNQFEVLVRSLGFKDTVESTFAGYYFHCVEGSLLANLMEAVTDEELLHTDIQQVPKRWIVGIDYLDEYECQCIMVGHKDHTYICESGLIPTHNTTLARIMGNYVNDGKCEPIEIDAASNNGVDSVREIIDQARAYPVGQKWKVFIIDECHAYTSNSWQALLKTLESSPAKSLFFLATTNPEKIPGTILSRVQQFQLSKISLAGINTRLKYVLDSENNEGAGIVYTDDAVNYVAKMANGGMRDALTLLDKSLSFSKELTIENVSQALNLPEYSDFFELLGAYASKDNAKIAAIVDKVYNSGVNFVKWFENFHSFVINIVKYIYLKDINKTMIPSTYQDKISQYSTPHLRVCLILANKLLTMIHELKSTQYLQEIALTNLCFVPDMRKKQ